jgi:hypothetical protein
MVYLPFVRQQLHPLVVLLVDAFARRSDVEPEDLWAWLAREKKAPRWWVEKAVAAFFPGLRESDFDVDDSLTSPQEAATLATMPQVETSTRKRKVSRAMLDPENRKHPLVKALVKEGVTVTALAKDMGYPRSSVQSWYDPNNPRPIPKAAALKLQKRFGIGLDYWRKVVD